MEQTLIIKFHKVSQEEVNFVVSYYQLFHGFHGDASSREIEGVWCKIVDGYSELEEINCSKCVQTMLSKPGAYSHNSTTL